jgi:hypothetical protein
VEPSKRVRYFVRNHQNQPLELHLAGGVVVVGPYREEPIGEGDLENAQLKVFRKKRLVSVREEADSEDAEPAEAAGEGSDTVTPVTEKSGGVKRRGTSKKEG